MFFMTGPIGKTTEKRRTEAENMTFQEQLSFYIDRFGIRQKQLAQARGLGEATVSRYLAGERDPKKDSEPIRRLAEGLASLAEEQGAAVSRDEILASLNATVDPGLTVGYDAFLYHLNLLLDLLNIRSVETARALNYDASHISKILSGARRPGNLKDFIEEVSSFIGRRTAGRSGVSVISRLTGAPAESLADASAVSEVLAHWLSTTPVDQKEEPVARFLGALDDFDLNEYLKAIRFDELRLPPAGLRLPTGKTYLGIKKMMQGELDFMKATVLSRSSEDVILYSDMPLQEMAEDPDFPKKWMLGMRMMLKKGLHLHIIHDVNRPFPEMMLGLEANIPMYMTGQISAYYLPASQGGVFSHLLKVSGAAALEGAAIAGRQGYGKYVLYRSREEIRHYRTRAEDLLEKALPLMDIYRRDRKEEYLTRLADVFHGDGLDMVCGSLPLFTLTDATLERLLPQLRLPEEDADAVRRLHESARKAAKELLDTNRIRLVIPKLTEEAFAASPLHPALSNLFIENVVPYTWETYAAHLSDTERFAAEHPNLSVEYNPAPAFRNITLTVVSDRFVIVSKEKSPAIHFVIHHKKMVRAFQKFKPPIVEN